MTEIVWQWREFEQLSLDELFGVLKLRQEVFVIEQDCVYADIDDIDQDAWHLLGYYGQVLSAYARVYKAPGELICIGRILTKQEMRGRGIGKQLMKASLSFIKQRFPGMVIKVSAQSHLDHFYLQFGFVKTSEPYDEDGIEHIDMLKTK